MVDDIMLRAARRQAEEYQRLKEAADRLPELEARAAEEARLADLQEKLEAAEADLAGRAERHRQSMHRNNTRLTGALRELANILAERRRIDSDSLYKQAKGVSHLRYQASGGKVHQHNMHELAVIFEGEAQEYLIEADCWPLNVYNPPGDVNVGAIAQGLSRVPVRIPRQESWVEIVGAGGKVHRERIA